MHAGVFILQNGKLVDLSEFFEHGTQIVFLQVSGDLPHEQFDNITIPGDVRYRIHRRRSGDQHVATPANLITQLIDLPSQTAHAQKTTNTNG